MGKRNFESDDQPAKVKKSKKSVADESVLDESVVQHDSALSYEEKLNNCNAIAQPMATEKDCKKIYKLLKKAAEKENELREQRKSSKTKAKPVLTCGIKAVQRAFRKGEKGICVLAGDITPIDIYCHLPILCEELHIPYVYVPSRYDVGGAMGLKRQCSVVLIHENEELSKYFETVQEVMQKRFDAVDFQSIASAC